MDAAGLMARDLQVGRVAAIGLGGAVVAQVAATQPGRLHLDYHFARPRVWVRQSADFDLSVASENYASHVGSLQFEADV